jgi:hypothetical protein
MLYSPDFYPTASGDQGLMLREELYLLLRGLKGDPAIGKWCVLRHFNKAVRSKYWDPNRNEAIGGPAWEYTDYLILAFRTRYTVGRTLRDADTPTIVGANSLPTDVWFLEWNSMPSGQQLQVDDELFQLNWSGATPPTQPYPYLDRHRIILPEPHYGELNGRLEYWGASTIREIMRGV